MRSPVSATTVRRHDADSACGRDTSPTATRPSVPATSDAARMPIFASASVRPEKASSATNSETVKPMPATIATPHDLAPVEPGWQPCHAQAHRDPRERRDAEDLPEHQAGQDPERHRARARALDRFGVE